MFQILGAENPISSNPLISLVIMYLPLALLILYGQRLQTWMILNDVSRAVGKLKIMREKSREDAIDYVSNGKKNNELTAKIDQILEYFTIMPVDMDPAGIVNKVEHVMVLRDERMRKEIEKLAPDVDSVKSSSMEGVVEIAASFNMIYKIVRHFYLVGKKTTSMFILAQLQMIMPMILSEAEALNGAMKAFKKSQPIGDGIGPMVVGSLMLKHEKKTIAKDTIYSKGKINGRDAYFLTAKGPEANVGQPGTAMKKLVEDMKIKPSAIIMIDAALKLEGEKTGEIAEGIGAAIGGIGVDRFKIEEVAVNNSIPLYAIVIKQSILDAISTMRKEIAESKDKVNESLNRLINEKTKEGDAVIIVGVGNTIGVAQ